MTVNAAVCGGQIFGIKRRFVLISQAGKVGLEIGVDSLTVTESSHPFPMKLSGPFASRVAHT